MIRRPPRSTLDRSSAASDVYKRQGQVFAEKPRLESKVVEINGITVVAGGDISEDMEPVSYTHLRAHETVLDLVCRLLLEKKNINTLTQQDQLSYTNQKIITV